MYSPWVYAPRLYTPWLYAPLTRYVTQGTWSHLRNGFRARADDVWVTGYQCAGNALVQFLVRVLLHGGDVDADHVRIRARVEGRQVERVRERVRPRKRDVREARRVDEARHRRRAARTHASWRCAAACSLSSPPRIVWRRRSLCAHTATTASWQYRPARRRRSRHPQQPNTEA